MSAPTATTATLTEHVRALFVPAAGLPGPGRVGLEVELQPVHLDATPRQPVAPAIVRRALESDPTLATEGRISFEPGGQVELSPAPAASPAGCLRNLESLLGRLRRCGSRAGIGFLPAALSPWSDAEGVGLQNSLPRYLVMQSHFDRHGTAGRRMMRLSAALQICLDLGAPERWLLLNHIGPAMASAFAASPLLAGRVTGERSTRIALWMRLDPTRTGFDGAQVGDDQVGAYESFALEAVALPLPREEGADGHAPSRPAVHTNPPSMREWLETRGARPDDHDVRHHLTTLFPPVRPRGYHEVRYLDALPPRWARVAVCLLGALTAAPTTERQALAAVRDSSPPPERETWRRAAHRGMQDPALRDTAVKLFDLALTAVPHAPAGYLPAEAARWLAEYRDRFPAAGRCPGDELREQYLRDPEDLRPWM